MASLPRVIPDFIDAWMHYTQYIPAPEIFRLWAGLFILSAATSRRVWTRTHLTFPPIFANLYAMLVGDPGSGKDMAINTASGLLALAQDTLPSGQGIFLGGESISAKGVLEGLLNDAAAFKIRANITGKQEQIDFHSMLLCIPELGTTLPQYDHRLISILNELYNCKESGFREQIRGRGNSEATIIPRPHLSMLLGIQPATLYETFPEQSFRSGFFARVNLIYTPETIRIRPYDKTRKDLSGEAPKLVSDLRSIFGVVGKMKETAEYEELLGDFSEKRPGDVNHSRFMDYNTRRWFHLHKVAMLCAVSENNSLRLEAKHFHRAKGFLFDAEKSMPHVFAGLSTSDGFQHSVEQTLHAAEGKSTISHQQLERTLRRTHRPTEVGQIIRSMIGAGDIIEIERKTTDPGLPVYTISREGLEVLH